MTLLEVITNASNAIGKSVNRRESEYPIVLNPDPVFRELRPDSDDPKSLFPVEKVVGWEISQTDAEIIESDRKFSKKLRRRLKDSKSFGKDEFVDILTSYLLKSAERVGISSSFDRKREDYACEVVEKLGFLISRDLRGLVLEGCIKMEVWNLLDRLIIKGLIERSRMPDLISKLIESQKSDSIVLAVKHLDLQAYDILCILKYFLLPPSDEHSCLANVMKHWEAQALSSIDKASGNGVRGEDLSLAKDAALSIMLAHDEFASNELCLHYLLASPNFDGMMFSACVGNLSGAEIGALVRYLGKWIRKYDRFPQAVPTPEASFLLGLEVCNWIPTLESVAKCVGMVVDEHFSSLVLNSELDEFASLDRVVRSLAAEAR
ncbi:hypothetical protein M569_00898, partial [Genlisea aurea]